MKRGRRVLYDGCTQCYQDEIRPHSWVFLENGRHVVTPILCILVLALVSVWWEQGHMEQWKRSKDMERPLRETRHATWDGTTTDGRGVSVDPACLDDGDGTLAAELSPDVWAEKYARDPVQYEHAIHVYCGLCGDCPQMDDADNCGGGVYCLCPCHEDGVARAARKEAGTPGQ